MAFVYDIENKYYLSLEIVKISNEAIDFIIEFPGGERRRYFYKTFCHRYYKLNIETRVWEPIAFRKEIEEYKKVIRTTCKNCGKKISVRLDYDDKIRVEKGLSPWHFGAGNRIFKYAKIGNKVVFFCSKECKREFFKKRIEKMKHGIEIFKSIDIKILDRKKERA